MFPVHVLQLALLLGGQTTPPAPAGPAVAVMRLQARGGITQDAAQLLSEYTVAQVRATNTFSRVVSPTEIEALITLEQTRQLMNCSDASCWAEVSGALGVDYVLIGSVGRVGGYVLINTSLVRVANATAVSESTKVCAQKEDQLVNAVEPLLAVTLADVGLRRADASASLALAELGRCETPVAAGQAAPGSAPAAAPARRDGVGMCAGRWAWCCCWVARWALAWRWPRRWPARIFCGVAHARAAGKHPIRKPGPHPARAGAVRQLGGGAGVGVVLGALALGLLGAGSTLLLVSLWT